MPELHLKLQMEDQRVFKVSNGKEMLLIDTICFRLLPHKCVVALFIRDEKDG